MTEGFPLDRFVSWFCSSEAPGLPSDLMDGQYGLARITLALPALGGPRAETARPQAGWSAVGLAFGPKSADGSFCLSVFYPDFG